MADDAIAKIINWKTNNDLAQVKPVKSLSDIRINTSQRMQFANECIIARNTWLRLNPKQTKFAGTSATIMPIEESRLRLCDTVVMQP